MLCCVVSEDFGVQAFLLTLSGTDFGGGELVQEVLERS
jgi:hypothetical protein